MSLDFIAVDIGLVFFQVFAEKIEICVDLNELYVNKKSILEMNFECRFFSSK